MGVHIIDNFSTDDRVDINIDELEDGFNVVNALLRKGAKIELIHQCAGGIRIWMVK